MSDLVGNPEDRFSQNEGHIVHTTVEQELSTNDKASSSEVSEIS